MDQKSLCHAFVLVMLCVFFLSMMTSASYLEFPLANLSTCWINKPSKLYLNSSIQASFSPILYRASSNGSQFISGFYCPDNDSRAANCLFGIMIFQTSVGNLSEYSFFINDPQLVWSANRDHPVHMNATLNFTESGDLILKDNDGTPIWSPNTGGKNVISLNLTTTGSLVFHSRNGTIVWQSFNHPTDTLLPDQILSRGQSLTSRTSSRNFSRGPCSLVLENSLTLYIQPYPAPAQSYFSAYSFENQYLGYDGRILRYEKALASTTAEFMRLDADGHLKIYVWDVFNWKVAADMLDEDMDECDYPLVCGKYGICSSGQCSCPDEANNQTSSFTPINSRQPNLGCTPSSPISCSNSRSHTLLDLKNTSYLNLDQWYDRTKLSSAGKIRLEDCKNSCLRNCSCKAGFFVYDMIDYFTDSTSSHNYNGCLLVSEVFSLKNTDGYSKVLAFLKVEEESSIKLNSSIRTSPRKRSSSKQIIVAGSSAAAFLGAMALLTFFFFLLRNKNETEELDEISFNRVSWIPTRFSYKDMKTITNNFLSKIGQGGFGSVFAGTLNDGTKVAVKRLDGHIKKSFLAEVESIGSIHHVNLVRLIGFCAEKSHRLLVYEYMPKGSLDKWIFQKNDKLSLEWEPRKNIILDIAKGLAYLHEDCRCKILHLDIKPQNILLDENLNAKVSDFGLAKLLDKDQSQVMTNLRGTPGYLAPEWLSSIITEKVDVYSFGIVVLEILCGRRNVDRSQPEESMHLVTLFKRKIEEGTLEDMVDMCNKDMLSHLDEIVKMMKIAKWCLQLDYSSRPSMVMVVKAIEDSLDVENNLGYEFTTSTTIAPGTDPEAGLGGTTILPPISLSGPR